MPIIKSAIKRVEVAERNRLRNRSLKSLVRTARTGVENALKSADPKEVEKALSYAYRVIDQAVSKGILHKNTGARRKSRLARLLVS